MKKHKDRFRTLSLAVILAAFSLPLATCGTDTYKCYLNCEDVTVPGSHRFLRLEDYSCEQCIAQFEIVRFGICGGAGNPNCICSYQCESLWEFSY